jgi:hypothetical protein
LPSVVPRLNPATFYDELDSPPPKMDEVLNAAESISSQEDLESTVTPRKLDEQLHPPNNDATTRTSEHDVETSSASGKELVLRPNTPSGHEGSKNPESDDRKSDDRKSEDLFLNIAQQHTGRQEITGRSASRQVSIGRRPSCPSHFILFRGTFLPHIIRC